jgi:type VI secretion system secreted protein VgrG
MDIYAIESSALPAEARVHSFHGREALCRPYRFDVHLTVPSANDVDLGDAIGAKVALTMQSREGEPLMVFRGIIAAAKLVHQNADFGLLRIRVVPNLWLLSLSRHSRHFTKKTVPEVISAVLEEAGISSSDFELRLRGSYEPEEHIAQYQESDLDFLHRWMEFEGIYYFFEHRDEGELLVITDSKATHEPLDAAPVRYHPVLGEDATAGGHFDSFIVEQGLRPAQIRLADYNYANPTLDLSARVDVSAVGFGEVNTHAGRVFSPDAAARIANIRKEELLCREAVARGAGTALHQRSGYLTTLEDHPASDLNAEHLVIEAEHSGYAGGHAPELDQLVRPADRSTYRVRLSAIPASVQFRPARTTRWPTVWGFEVGVIDGPDDSEYAQIDDQGRYAVKMRFDESDLKEGRASTYLRMQQPHGGGVEGFHFPLRKNTEVMLTFQGGDPDRPVISGVLPNALTPSPVTSSNHTTNIIQTGGRNRIEMEDLNGSQRVTFYSPTKNTFLRLGAPNDDYNMFLFSEGVGCIWVGGRFDWRTGGDKVETVEDTVTEIFTGPFTTHVLEGDTTEEYNADKEETVAGALTEDYREKMTVDVTGPVNETYSSQTTTVAHPREEILQGAITETYTGPLTVQVGGAVTETYQAGYDLNVTGLHSTRVWSSVNETFGDFEQVTNNWLQVNKGVSTSTTVGATFELIIGLKNENIIGVKLELTPGMKSEFTAALRIGLHASIKFENFDMDKADFGAKIKNCAGAIKKRLGSLVNRGVRADNAGVHVQSS